MTRKDLKRDLFPHALFLAAATGLFCLQWMGVTK